jgi:glycosyltransferase involved in cell wall biosynthesis
LVDNRWTGQHGIGRYAREVVPRLSVTWAPLQLDGSPSAPLDFLRAVPGISAGSIVYSPGYNALLRSGRQVLTVHDLIHLQSDWPGRAKYVAYYGGPVRHVVRRSGIVITDSKASVDAIREWVRDDSVKIVNAGVGCSPEFHPNGPTEQADEPYLLAVSNMRRHKNLDTLLLAISRVPELRLRVVLPASEADAANRRIAELGIASRVEALQGVSDERLAELYRGAVATVMPSTLEGFGLPPLESIHCGTPVVYWAGCAPVAETVGEKGHAVEDARDPDEWAESLVEATRNPQRVSPPRPGEYDWSRTASVISATLADALGHGSQESPST